MILENILSDPGEGFRRQIRRPSARLKLDVRWRIVFTLGYFSCFHTGTYHDWTAYFVMTHECQLKQKIQSRRGMNQHPSARLKLHVRCASRLPLFTFHIPYRCILAKARRTPLLIQERISAAKSDIRPRAFNCTLDSASSASQHTGLFARKVINPST